jgi:hypothetical protein
VIPLLGIYSKECKTGYNSDPFTPMFVAALFIIAKLWKQPSYPITDEWIKEMWYLYGEYYSAIGKMTCGLKGNGCNWRASC